MPDRQGVERVESCPACHRPRDQVRTHADLRAAEKERDDYKHAAGAEAQLFDEANRRAEAAEHQVEALREAIGEAYRCLTLIGHVPRAENTWAARAEAATKVLGRALTNTQGGADGR